MTDTITQDTISIQEVGQLDSQQQLLLRDEAVATWTSRNRIREALTAKIAQRILEGQDVSALIAQLDKLCSPDAFLQQVLAKLM